MGICFNNRSVGARQVGSGVRRTSETRSIPGRAASPLFRTTHRQNASIILSEKSRKQKKNPYLESECIFYRASINYKLALLPCCFCVAALGLSLATIWWQRNTPLPSGHRPTIISRPSSSVSSRGRGHTCVFVPLNAF